MNDRRVVEEGFMNGNISIICSTSTLAVGVNLPCYLVILKGTQGYGDNGLQEYSGLEVTQMLGRAGRPQFESEACAVILCFNEHCEKYKKMTAGEEVLESSLHQNLIEHLNAEISMGTVSSLESAKKWLSSTFLNVRLQANPKYYEVGSHTTHDSSDAALEDWCRKNLKLLLDCSMVEDVGILRSTEYGDAMARYYVKFDTMKTFMASLPKAKISEVLETLSQAVEFREYRYKVGDKGLLKELNQEEDIRYPIKVDIAQTKHKVSLIIQAKLGCVPLGREGKSKRHGSQIRQLNQDAMGVLSHAKRLIRCMIDVLVQHNDSVAVKNALELARGLAAGVWDDTASQLKQLPGIGDISVRKLAAAGLETIESIVNIEPHRLEVILSRNPPFGHDLIQKAAEFPLLRVSVQEVTRRQIPAKGVEVKLSCSIGFLNQIVPLKFNKKPFSVLFLCETSYGELVDFRRFGPARLTSTEHIVLTPVLSQPSSKLCCHIMCDDLAGTHRFAELDVQCPISWFPPIVPVMVQSALSGPTVHAIVGSARKISPGNFENEGLEDADFMFAASLKPSRTSEIYESDDIDDVDDLVADTVGEKKSTQSLKRNVSDQNKTLREPRRLPNGHWTCQHSCNDDGKKCKHRCCAEGVKVKAMRLGAKKQKITLSIDTAVVASSKQQCKNRSSVVVTCQPDEILSKRNLDVPCLELQKRDELLSDLNNQQRDPLESQIADNLRGIDGHKSMHQATSDEFCSGDYDWETMDDIASMFEANPAHKTERTEELAGHEAYQQFTPQTESIRNCFREDSEHDGANLNGRKSPSTSSNGAAGIHMIDAFTGNYRHKVTEIGTNERNPHSTISNSVPNSRLTDRSKVASMPSSISSLHLDNSQDAQTHLVGLYPGKLLQHEADEERKLREDVEDQKRRWAVFESDFLSYENFGSVVEIVDSD